MAEYLIQDSTLAAIADAIRMKTGKDDPIPVADMANEISNISVDGGDVVLRYVTFMSYDGTVEYGKKAVVYGDDCADPIALGVFETPTRESTAEYNYTFAGWATEPNGGLDSNALKDIRANKTVYANFVSVLRYYTITYYDSDGTTVLKTESLAYGAEPTYSPSRDGSSFLGWVPSLTKVKGDAEYCATWAERITFAGGSWAEIAAIAEAGEAADYFALGDSRTIPVTIDGTSYNFEARIVGFNHDTKSDGSKAGLSILFFTVPATEYKLHSSAYSGQTYHYANCDLSSTISGFINNLPADLRSVIKTVSKQYNKPGKTTILSTNVKMWIPSATEVLKASEIETRNFLPVLNSQYAYFQNNNFGHKTDATYCIKDTSKTAVSGYWLRDVSNFDYRYTAFYYNGSNLADGSANLDNYMALGFCI